MSAFLDFWNLGEAQNFWVLIGALILGGAAGAIGSFNFLRRRSLVGDALAHSALPGITTAFFLFQTKDISIIATGAMLSCFLGYFAIEYLVNNTKIKEDSALAIVLSLFFAVGVFQLTLIQKIPTASQAGLESMLFGKAQAMVPDDLRVLAVLGGLIFAFLFVFFRQLKVITFDRVFAETLGIKLKLFEALLGFLVVITIVIGVQMVGVVLMAALVLTPAAAARYLTNSLGRLVVLSAAFGAFSGGLGANISYISPRMPTGPWMVVVVSVIFLLCAVFSPERGILMRFLRRKKNRQMIREENVVRTIFKIGGEVVSDLPYVRAQDVLLFRNMSQAQLRNSLEGLVKKGLLSAKDELYCLTPEGVKQAIRLTRYHRLWEAYLSESLMLPEDHLHEDAEEMEHVITEEIEQQILEELGATPLDPHGRLIPESE